MNWCSLRRESTLRKRPVSIVLRQGACLCQYCSTNHLAYAGIVLWWEFSCWMWNSVYWSSGLFSQVYSCRCIIDVMLLGWVWCTKLIRTLITVCSASFHLLPLECDITEQRPQLIHWLFEVSRCRTSNLYLRNAEWHSVHCVWYRNAGYVQ